ncbi:sensor histidine kinase [Paucibacter sp. APW11]|uniref:histidine kinase n=1 Tax=Roseateles aquae TaxID=3077235 RepID=A0ABU3PH39_9BURK|nr:sensor histidine kinase [Paucibacter sp. APW11]MDT9001883.1 sensor histidine kinase [Paucibacter sp. APW11]
MVRLSHAFRQQPLARQLVLQLSALVALMLCSLAGIAYVLLNRLAEQSIPPVVRRTISVQARQQGQTFQLAEASARRLSAEWLQRIDAPSDAQVQARFDALFERQADGVWRVRPRWLDPERRPTFYLQHGQQGPDASVRRRAVASYELLSEQGPALVPPFFSVYTDFVEKGLMVYSRGIDWGRGATPATDNFNYPTMTGSDPARNPGRRLFWTPVYFDGEARAWMVSVIQPLDWQGRWVGTVGHDITIDALLKQIAEAESPLDSLSMIVSRDGQLIAHPQLRAQIEAAQGQLALSALKQPMLDSVYALLRQQAGDEGVARTADGRYLVGWARIGGPGWWSVRVVPQARIDELLQRTIAWMLLIGVVGLLLAVALLHRVVRHRLQRPLEAITGSIEALASRLHRGEEAQPLPPQASGDLQRLNCAFDTMAAELVVHRRQEQAAQTALQSEVEERRQAEEAVRLLNLSLEARVRERGEALQQAQHELVQRETLASLGALVAGVSHELNTPIGNALIASDTATEALRAARAHIASGTVRRGELLRQLQHAEDSMALALGNLRRSAGLVEDFKQVAIDRASLQRRPFGLRRVCEEVVHLLHHSLKAQEHEVRIQISDSLSLDSYPGAFGQVLTNLVQNAVVHGFEGRTGGLITIALQSAEAEQIVLSISDDGCGIPPEHLDQVFKPFFTTRLGKGGSGLGLHLVYNIVHNVLGGRIELRSTPGQGTCFTLQLPRVAPAEPSTDAESLS